MAYSTSGFTELKEGWDGYKGIAPKQKTCDVANMVAESLKGIFHVRPQFVPGSGGEVQVEFHSKDFSAEVWIENKMTE